MVGMGERGDEWQFERIGTDKDKMQTEKELQVLRERLAEVESLKQRREEIERELAEVWVDSGETLDPPPYAGTSGESESAELVESTESVEV